ncbi:MAG TPA: hypothetical protein PLU87_03015 [Sedimentisphaerales bacterium]|nr:hypothetical protein [Sedimentisphaerales bacterium]HRS09993.1 hypothetical protein [Sedimentisphaerales bacterium]HRV46699.1 hypothetical protein [Sedimentisphaerales bacterium]
MQKSNRTRLILVGVGILLVLFGLRGVALGLVGRTAQASVTEVKEAVSQQDNPMDHNYLISYRFSVNGRDYTGTFTRKKVYNTATLPSVGGVVPIRYLAAAPAINGGPDAGPVGGLIFGGLGLLLLFLGIRPARLAASSATAEDANADSRS